MRLLTMCTRNLFRRKFRTALCVTGIALATMFIVAVGATTTRYATVIKEMNVLFNGQILVVEEKAIVIQAIPLGSSLAEKTANDIQQTVDGVQKAVPILFLTPIGMGAILQPVPVNFTIGIPIQNWQVLLGNTQLRTGGYWPTNDSDTQVVTGASLADQFNWTVGSKITINSYELDITGVLDTNIAIFSRSIIMPLQLAQKIYTYPLQINMIAVTPDSGHSEEEVANLIKQEVPHVNALTEDERNDIIQPVLAQVELWNIGIRTVILLLSLILVMTVTIMTVSERRRDFATLEAIGAPLNYVFRLVIVETALIGLMGSIIGLALGSFASLVLASLYTNIPIAQFFPTLFDITPPLFLIEISVSTIVVCCIGGMIPAIRAAKTRISEVLRAEY